LTSEKNRFPNAVRSVPTPVDVQFLSTLERRMATTGALDLPIRYTTGTLPTNKAIKTLHMMPVTKLGNSRTIVRIGERRR
jgi:hypothetical protein